MPEIRSIQNSDRRISVIEDPNPTYSRVFIDTIAHDLTTLTPYWTKTFHFNYGGFQMLCTGNCAIGGSSWQAYWAACWGPGQGLSRAGLYTGTVQNNYFPWNVTRGQNTVDTNLQFPTTDDGFFRAGIMHLQKGTISCYAAGDGYANNVNGTMGGAFAGARSTMNFQFDTYHQTLDFANFPILKSKKLSNGKNLMLLPGDRGLNLTGWGGNMGGQPWMNANDGWMLYNDDITSNDAIYSTVSSLSGAWLTPPGSSIVYEDSANNYLWTVSTANPCKPFITRITNPGTTSPTIQPYSLWNTLTNVQPSFGNMSYRLFFVGTDTSNNLYWLQANDYPSGGNSSISVYKIPPATSPTAAGATITVLDQFSANSTSVNNMRITPSNIRRDVANNRYVFYTHQWDSNFNLQPIRYVFNPISGNVLPHWCQLIHPTGDYRTYAQSMSLTGQDTANNANPWMHRPMQFTSNGNNYITFWFADQAASIVGTSSGTTRWATKGQRTMMTYTMPNGLSDNVLTFHSAYTFQSVYDIPKNFMPVDANGTTMIVPSAFKTSFFRWNDTTGWYVGSVYNTEFRSVGMDSTGRIWGYAMDKNNGNIHIISPTIPVNVSVVMSNTNFTYTGTTLSPTATVNAYDYFGNRLAANVTLTIDGGTMNFATNSSKTLSLTTSNTTDTLVTLSIAGGGVNNIYAAISV